MGSYAETSADTNQSLIVAKGSFVAMGGAERDLLRIIPSLTKFFDVKVATLNSVPELEKLCEKFNIPLFTPKNPWEMPRGIISTILDTGINSATRAWKNCEGLSLEIKSADAIHIVSGDGSLGLLKCIPVNIPCHLHLLEPHRGLHEDVLHFDIQGKPKRNLKLTKLLLSYAKMKDKSIIKNFNNRNHSTISSNSNYSSERAKIVYGIKTGVLWPCVDISEFPQEDTNDIVNPYDSDDDYVVAIGKASFVKGSWETISMISGTKLSLVHVGGGDSEDIIKLQNHAKRLSVNFWVAPRLSSSELVPLMRNSRAVISMAYGEAFGLTPIEAFALGTPAIFVNEGGFTDTISDDLNGRLLERDDISSWHEALKQAKNVNNREKWMIAGREKILKLDLSPQEHAKRIKELFFNLRIQ